MFRSAGNEETLWFAELLSVWRDLPTCATVTRAANAFAADIHDRMLVILSTTEREAWLAGSNAPSLGADYRLRYHPVRPFGTRDDGEALIQPVT